MRSPDREVEWMTLMHAAVDGDVHAYRRLLESITPLIRATAIKACRRYAAPLSEVEDAVQETLISIHLKRHTWRRGDPLGPWIAAIARNKLIDALRRRTRRAEIEINEFVLEMPAVADQGLTASRDIDKLLSDLPDRDRLIVRSVSIEGRSMRQTGEMVGMSEGAVRVALHRALKRLSASLRKESE